MKNHLKYSGARRRWGILMVFSLAICAAIAAVSGCRSPQQREQTAAEVKHYQLEGEVVSVDAPNKRLVVKHGDIPGFMEAMTMPYPVADVKELNGLAAGDRIRAELVVSDGEAVLHNVTLVSKAKTETPSGTSEQRIPARGDAVPDFRFVNQDGQAIHLRQFRGKALLITFIYTRCPLPDFCPKMNDNFVRVRAALKEDATVRGRLQLLTLSFDPKNDTPAELRRYAARYRSNNATAGGVPWDFAVPAAKDLSEIARYFGLTVLPEKDQIVHSLSTTVAGPDGKVFSWYHGNDWTPEDAARDIAAALRAAPANGPAR
jgi:protein SCO1/2